MKKSKSIQPMTEFYAMSHYLVPKEFVLYSNHEDFQIHQLSKEIELSPWQWVFFLQEYAFVIKHKAGNENKPADALNHVEGLSGANSFFYGCASCGL